VRDAKTLSPVELKRIKAFVAGFDEVMRHREAGCAFKTNVEGEMTCAACGASQVTDAERAEMEDDDYAW
jgi:hypothetical protein